MYRQYRMFCFSRPKIPTWILGISLQLSFRQEIIYFIYFLRVVNDYESTFSVLVLYDVVLFESRTPIR